MIYHYIESDGTKHRVTIHNFSNSDKTIVRVCGSIVLNFRDPIYSDKKWVKRSELFELGTKNVAEFTEDFIKANTL